MNILRTEGKTTAVRIRLGVGHNRHHRCHQVLCIRKIDNYNHPFFFSIKRRNGVRPNRWLENHLPVLVT